MSDEVLLETGGEPDEVALVLAVYGPNLIPAEVTALTGARPTESWARGEVHPKTQKVTAQGVWLLEFRAHSPRTLHDLLATLQAALRPDLNWGHFTSTYDVQVSVALHSDCWNFGQSLTPSDLAWLSGTGAPLHLDIYAYAGHEEEVDGLNVILAKPRT